MVGPVVCVADCRGGQTAVMACCTGECGGVSGTGCLKDGWTNCSLDCCHLHTDCQVRTDFIILVWVSSDSAQFSR